MSDAETWVKGFDNAVRDFSSTRQSLPPAVRVTLRDGDVFLAARMAVGPDPDFISIDAAVLGEKQALADRITVPEYHDGHEVMRYYTPRTVIVRLADVIKVELLAEIPPRPSRWWRRGEVTVRAGVINYRLPGSES